MKEEAFRESIKVYKPNDQQQARLYDRFINQQEGQFELYINYINEVLCTLKHYRIVTDITKFNARIKSLKSALDNDEQKALDDVFGIEVEFAIPGEKAFVSEIIKSTLSIRKERIHNNDNGYIASHCVGYPAKRRRIKRCFEELLEKSIDPEEEYQKYFDSLPIKKQENIKDKKEEILNHFIETQKSLEAYAKAIKYRINNNHMEQLKEKLDKIEGEYITNKNIESLQNIPLSMADEEFSTANDPGIPMIEFQSKTIQAGIVAYLGSARHDKTYKPSNSRITQEEYDSLNGQIPLSRIPTMYSSDLKVDQNGKPIPPKILSSDETLRKLYPELITNTDEVERGDL